MRSGIVALLSIFIVGGSALRTQITPPSKSGIAERLAEKKAVQMALKKRQQEELLPIVKPDWANGAHPGNKLDQNGITYSLQANDQFISNGHQSAKGWDTRSLAKIEETYTTGAMKDVGPMEDYLEMWYVTTKKATDRRKCMDQQIEEMGLKSHVFQAIQFGQCMNNAGEEIISCLTRTGHGDCVKRGVNHQAIATHGSAGNEDFQRALKIVSNACSHKRAMADMDKAYKENKTKAKYAVLMEDDVAFDRKDFLRKLVNFIEKYDGRYNSTWQMVQIDPFGSKCDRQIAGFFEGLPVWRPANVNNDWDCSNYWGAHALLVKMEALPAILKHMETHQTVPLDWLPADLNADPKMTALAWHANIARNPEAQNQWYGGIQHHQKVQFPEYCKKNVAKSTIGDA